MTPQRFLVVRDQAPDAALHGAVVAMGNFDGVHRGHRAVIAAAEDRARSLGKPAAVLTFEPHPRAFFHPGEPLFRLTDETAKLRLLASTGLDGAIVLTFDAALASLTADRVRRAHPGRAVRHQRRRDRLQLSFRQEPHGLAGLPRGARPQIRLQRRCGRAFRARRPSGLVRPDPRRARRRTPGRGGGFARLSLVRVGRGDPWRQTRP